MSVNYLNNPFSSFLMGGYECCDMLNNKGERVDLLTDTGHVENAGKDYDELVKRGIYTVREGIRWSKVEKTPYVYDWSEVDLLIEAGKEKKIQQVWDICHFGMPSDISPVHPKFANRFVAICEAFTRHMIKKNPDQLLLVTPINEVSFFSWLGGEVAGTTPYALHNGWHVKYQLCKAYILAVEAMRKISEEILIVTTEPLVNIIAPKLADKEEKIKALSAHEDQFQVTDILLGRICPELGGHQDIVDIIGYNYYYTNQFNYRNTEVLDWLNRDHDYRFIPLHKLLLEGFERYEKPIFLAETSHTGNEKQLWYKMIIKETSLLKELIPFYGICWYPVLNRPDWDDTTIWHDSGLQELEYEETNEEELISEKAFC